MPVSQSFDPESLRSELIARARDMFPIIRERAAEAEANRRLHDETQKMFVEAGFYRIFQPKRYGGYEMDFSVLIDLCAEIGRADGSACWVFSNLTGQSWINGMKTEQAQDDVWGDNPDALIASSFPGKGATVKEVDGGWVVDGQWSFCSGVDFADWSNLQLFVKQENGPSKHYFALVPMEDFEIVDDWFASGLAATGSRSFRVNEVFIPRHRGLAATDATGGPTPGSDVNPHPIYKMPFFAIGNKQYAGSASGSPMAGWRRSRPIWRRGNRSRASSWAISPPFRCGSPRPAPRSMLRGWFIWRISRILSRLLPVPRPRPRSNGRAGGVTAPLPDSFAYARSNGCFLWPAGAGSGSIARTSARSGMFAPRPRKIRWRGTPRPSPMAPRGSAPCWTTRVCSPTGNNPEIVQYRPVWAILDTNFSSAGSTRRQTMAKLRHLAMSVPDPEATAKFYMDAFDMKLVGRTNSPSPRAATCRTA